MSDRIHLEPPAAFNMGLTLSVNKTVSRSRDGYVWSTRTPDGPAAVQIQPGPVLEITAWGEGAAWALAQCPTLLGFDDKPELFVPTHDRLKDLARRNPGLRIGATHRAWEVIFWAILGQKVQVTSANRSRRELMRKYSARAPGPDPQWLVPAADVIAELGMHDFHAVGIEQKRAKVLREIARRVIRVEETCDMPPADADKRLQAFRGIGPWTSAFVRLLALGDADAIPIGDYHLPNKIAWLLAQEPRADDERMLELLEPYVGQRGRIFKLVKTAGEDAPRRGPKLSSPDIRTY